MFDNGLVDMQPLADVANNVINKISAALGWVVIPRGTRKDMNEAVENYIKEIEEDDSIPPIVKAAKIATARRDIKEYINIQDILYHAEEFGRMYEQNDENDLDEDWVMFFYDKAKNVSRDDAKVLWGKVLAEECHEAGSIPKQLVHILSIMSRENADAFKDLCGFKVKKLVQDDVNGGLLIVGSGIDRKPIYEKSGLSYERLHDLQSLGLISVNVIDSRIVLEEKGGRLSDGKMGFLYHGHLISVGNLREEVPIGYVSLTAVGVILSNIIVSEPLDGFLEYIKEYYEENGFTVSIE